MSSQKLIENYKLVEKVYGNYTAFQQKLIPLIQKYDNANKPVQVLEIGTGTGVTTNLVLKSREDIELTSIDIDSTAINISKKRLSDNNNLEFVESDALSFANAADSNCYDIIVSAFTIHNQTIDCRKDLYREFYRVLKPEGLFLNADKFVSDNFDLQVKSLKYRISTYIDVLLREGEYDLLEEWVQHYIEDSKPNKIMKLTEEMSLLRNSNFASSQYIFKSEKEMLAIVMAIK